MSHCTFAPNLGSSTPRRSSHGGAKQPPPPAEPPPAHVVDRLYQPAARTAQFELLDRMRDERRQEEEQECSFHPQTNKPLRTNVATNVASRFRRPSPKPDRRTPLPTGEEQCTFSPAVNRMPRAISHAVSDYLEDPAHVRLSRLPPPSPRGTADPANSSAGRGGSLSRSSSVPGLRTGGTTPGGRGGGGSVPPSPGGPPAPDDGSGEGVSGTSSLRTGADSSSLSSPPLSSPSAMGAGTRDMPGAAPGEERAGRTGSAHACRRPAPILRSAVSSRARWGPT